MKTKKMLFGNSPSLAFEPGQVLHGYDPEACEVSGEAAYYSARGLALFRCLRSNPEDNELQLGILPDGRWALVGCQIEGHPFAVEVQGEE